MALETVMGNGSKSPAVHSSERDSSPKPLSTKVLPLSKPDGREGSGLGPSVQLPSVEIDFADLKDGSLVDLVEDPENPMRTLLAVWKDGDISYHEKLEHGGLVLLPLPRSGQILKHVRLPRDVRPYESAPSLLLEVMKLISQCVELNENYVFLLASFVFSTWLVDRLPIAPYVSVVGLPQSGKTTLLQVLSLVCRRPLLTADVSSAAFYSACEQLTPTLLIDEAGTHEDKRALRHLLRMGTTRDVVAVRRNQVYRAYGAKVISWLEPPDDPALNSRCLLIPMTESNNPNLVRPTDSHLEARAAELQSQLLQFRFKEYRKIEIPAIPKADGMRPRLRDLWECLAAPFADYTEICEDLCGFVRLQAWFVDEPLSPSQGAVLAALFSAIHQQPYAGLVLVQDLTTSVNNNLKEVGERFRLQPRCVGAIITAFGFSERQRTNRGWNVLLRRTDQERIHRMASRHGLDYLRCEYLRVSRLECPLCRQM